MDRATPIASPQKASRSRCSSCSSINGCADRSPTAVSTIAPTPNIDPTAASKPPITAPTKQSNMSSNFSPQLDSAARQYRTRLVYDPSGKNLSTDILRDGHPGTIACRVPLHLAMHPPQDLTHEGGNGERHS